MKKYCLFCILFAFVQFSLAARSPLRSFYNICNISGEDLLLTVHYVDDALIPMFHGGERNKRLLRQTSEQDSYRYSLSLFEDEPQIEILRGTDGEWQFILVPPPFPPKEMVEIVIKELILHDLEGNIVLTLDDIQEGHFEYTATHRGEKLSPYLMVTPEMVQTGREKYGESRQQEENSGNQ